MFKITSIQSERITEEQYAVESLRGVDLDNAIYDLRNTNVSSNVRDILHKADVAYLQDREQDAAELLWVAIEIIAGVKHDTIVGTVDTDTIEEFSNEGADFDLSLAIPAETLVDVDPIELEVDDYCWLDHLEERHYNDEDGWIF